MQVHDCKHEDEISIPAIDYAVWKTPYLAPTYVLFERTGRISLLRLLKVLDLLGLLDEFDQIGRAPDLTGLKLEDLVKPQRQRGSRKRS